MRTAFARFVGELLGIVAIFFVVIVGTVAAFHHYHSNVMLGIYITQPAPEGEHE